LISPHRDEFLPHLYVDGLLLFLYWGEKSNQRNPSEASTGLSCQLFILLLLSLMPKLPLLFSEEKGAGGMSWKSFRRPGVLINRASRDQRPRRFAPPPEGVGLMPSPESGGLSVFHRTSKNTGMRSTSLVVMPLKYHRWICR